MFLCFPLMVILPMLNSYIPCAVVSAKAVILAIDRVFKLKLSHPLADVFDVFMAPAKVF